MRAGDWRARPDEGDGREPSEYRWMWLFAMFDLPVGTKEERKEATRFRVFLLSQGFFRLQWSVYAKHFTSEEGAAGVRGRVRGALPDRGHVRLLLVTDRQFGKMESFIGRKQHGNEPPPEQLLLF